MEIVDIAAIAAEIKSLKARTEALERELHPDCARCGKRAERFTGSYDWANGRWELSTMCHGEKETRRIETLPGERPCGESGRWLDTAFDGSPDALVRRQG